MQISLNDVVLIRIKIFQVPRQEDTSTLSCGLRFRDKRFSIWLPSLSCLITELFLEFAEFCWQEPCLWKEFVILGIQGLHALEVPGQMILPSKCVHSREMIDALIGFHSIEFINLDCTISPKKVPFIVRIRIIGHIRSSAQSHFEHAPSNITYDIVFRLRNVKHQLFSLEPTFFLLIIVFTIFSSSSLVFFFRAK